MICDCIISPHLCIATKGQRSRECGKLFLSSVVPLVVNGGTIFFKHMPEDAGDKRVKVKKRRRQDILRFRTDARKLILGSIGTPLDHLSVNPRPPKGGFLTVFALVLKITQPRGKTAPGTFKFILSLHFSEKIPNLPPTPGVG